MRLACPRNENVAVSSRPLFLPFFSLSLSLSCFDCRTPPRIRRPAFILVFILPLLVLERLPFPILLSASPRPRSLDIARDINPLLYIPRTYSRFSYCDRRARPIAARPLPFAPSLPPSLPPSLAPARTCMQ